MLKLSLALVASATALALPAAHAVASKPGPRTVEQALLRQMNSGPDGTITRRVACASDPKKARRTFACRLVSVRATSLRVDAALVDGGLRTTWHPLQG